MRDVKEEKRYPLGEQKSVCSFKYYKTFSELTLTIPLPVTAVKESYNIY